MTTMTILRQTSLLANAFSEGPEDFVAAKFSCLSALADGS